MLWTSGLAPGAQEARRLGGALPLAPVVLGLSAAFALELRFTRRGMYQLPRLTDIRAMEETSRRQERLSAVGRVAAVIAHEIRNPLAAMRGSIQVLRSELPADAPKREPMDKVLSESDRLNHIITDFLTYARPRKFFLAECDLREPVCETFALLRHSPEVLDGRWLKENLPEEPLPAMAEAEGIRHVFWNLTSNALKAMPDGGTLRPEMRRTAQGASASPSRTLGAAARTG